MRPSTIGGEPGSLNRFRRLTFATAVLTIVLIVIGGVVRISESGLGCGPAGSGLEGWPLCNGAVLPFAGGATLVEFTHRVVAGAVAMLVALLTWLAWRQHRDHRWLVWGATSALILILAQAVLGGLTVEHDLDAVLVAIHLGVAMVLLAILLAMFRAARSRDRESALPATGVLKVLAGLAVLLTLATIVAGGYVAGTEGEGRAEKPVAGAHTACGTDFPACGDALLPFGRDSMVDAQLTHRVLMFAATLAVLGLAGIALRNGLSGGLAAIAAIVILLQVLLGAINVWVGKHAGLIVGHLTLGTVVWVIVVWICLRFAEVPEPAIGAADRRGVRALTDAA